MHRNYTCYRVSIGRGTRVLSYRTIAVLNGSLNMLKSIRDVAQTKYGALAWVKFERI